MHLHGQAIYVATTNAGKLRDFAAASQAFEICIEPLTIVKEIAEPVEDGATFAANARLKAEYYSRHAPGLWVLADDSGLEVDALGGAPGVRSARFAADEGFASRPGISVDDRNNACLLSKLTSRAQAPLNMAANLAAEASAHPEALSSARYRCVLALARDGITETISEGSVEGQILSYPRGAGGFGYDPLFWLAEHQQTMAEIDLATKQQISHRGRALQEMLQNLL